MLMWDYGQRHSLKVRVGPLESGSSAEEFFSSEGVQQPAVCLQPAPEGRSCSRLTDYSLA